MENVKLTEREHAVLNIIAQGRVWRPADQPGSDGEYIARRLRERGLGTSAAGAHRTAASLVRKKLAEHLGDRPRRYAVTPLGLEVLRRAARQAKKVRR